MSNPTYVLGSSPRGLSRLSLQAQMIGPITERLLLRLGIKEGSRVLDLGCGAGDVSMLAAEMVGAMGSVVGIDQSAADFKSHTVADGEGLRAPQFCVG